MATGTDLILNVDAARERLSSYIDLPDHYVPAIEAFARRWWEELQRRAPTPEEFDAQATAAAIAAGRTLTWGARPTTFMAWGAVLMLENLDGGRALRVWFEELGLAPSDDTVVIGDFVDVLENPDLHTAVVMMKVDDGRN